MQKADLMDDFGGIEFDWFTFYASGNIGIFSFGGYSFIPGEILAHHEAHTLISPAIPLPNTGSLQVWGDYANYGLFILGLTQKGVNWGKVPCHDNAKQIHRLFT